MLKPSTWAKPIPLGPDGLSLYYDINALCRMEELTDEPFFAIMHRMSQGLDIRLLRAITKAGLGHMEEERSIEEVGELIAEIGIKQVQAAVLVGMQGIVDRRNGTTSGGSTKNGDKAKRKNRGLR